MDYTTKWLRLEGAAVLIAAVAVFAYLDASWWVFAALILAPDLAMVGYLAGTRAGAFAYNLVHLYLWPGGLLVWALAGGPAWAGPVAAVWAAHIGMDRAFGYGLKESDAFRHTHLGWIGAGGPGGA